jgi:DtxR family Mn-dependent transcriptional regulator
VTDLIDTTEMYLRTILELEEEGQTPLRARIAERIGHSGPTVSQTVARMERDGLVVVEEDRHLRLTPKGLERATQVMRKHRLAERLLVDVIGLEWAQVHDEACRWEHVMSEEVERRLVDILDHPHLSPYGNPIPGLDQLGEGYQGGGEAFLDGVVSLPDAVAAGREGPFRVVRLGEVLQTDIGRLAGFDAAGVRPGATVTVSEGGPGLVLQADGAPEALRLEADLARHIYVAA